MPHVETYIDGVFYPSVTTILGDKPKPWLNKWREKWGPLAVRKTALSGLCGDKFHLYAEYLAKGICVEEPKNKRLLGMLLRFDRWILESGFRVKETELHVVSMVHRFQGTFDATGYTKDSKELTLFDWKTTSSISEDVPLQLVAYAQGYFEQTGIWIKRGVVVHVSKEKPDHTLTVKEWVLNKRLLNKFLNRLRKFRENNDPIKVKS